MKRIKTTFYEKDKPTCVIYSDEPYTTIQTDPPDWAMKLEWGKLARFRVLDDDGEWIELDKDKDPYNFVKNFWRHFYGYYSSASKPEVVKIEERT